MTDPYADYTVADNDGAELSIVWVKGGGARIYVYGGWPHASLSILRSREEMVALRDYLDAQLAERGSETYPQLYTSPKGIWHVRFKRDGKLVYSSMRTRNEMTARRLLRRWFGVDVPS
jgi:hypothetical protein